MTASSAEPPEVAMADSVAASDDMNEEVVADAPAPEITPPEAERPVDATERASAPPVVKVERRGGFFPLLIGGLAAGGIGFGTAAYVLPRFFPTSDDAVATLSAEVGGQAEKLTALDSSLADMRRAQEAQSAVPAVPDAVSAEIADIGARLETLDRGVSALGEKVASLDTRLSTTEQRPVTGDAASAAALEAFQREMEGFRAEIAAQKQAVEAAKGDIVAAASAAAATIDTVKVDAEKMRSDAEAAARSATIQGSISRIEAALDSGAALGEPIAELRAAGIDVPVALGDQAQGIPTLTALRDSFPAAARLALAASVQQGAGSDTWSRITAFFRSQSGARSLTPRAGDDPDAILSRAEANLHAGDLSNALTELKSLPEAGQAVMAEWMTRADRRVQAVAAAATLKQQVE